MLISHFAHSIVHFTHYLLFDKIFPRGAGTVSLLLLMAFLAPRPLLAGYDESSFAAQNYLRNFGLSELAPRQV